MPISRKPLRFAHSDGHTSLCYDDSGRHLVTAGSDGDVRIWEGFDDDDAISHRAGDYVNCVAYKNERFYTAADDNAVKVHMFKEGQSDGILTRFTAPVTHMVFNKNGTSLLAGASDFTVKVVEVDTSSQQMFEGHQAPVLSVAYDPKEQFVASSSCDGTAKIWKLEDQSCAKTLSAVVPKCNDFSASKALCRMSWNKNGTHLAVPMEKEIKFYERDTWVEAYTISDPEISELISIIEFSPCGRYLAAACIDGRILIWDLATKSCVSKERHEGKLSITSLAWDPRSNGEIAYTDMEGQMGLLTDVLPEQGSKPFGESTSNELAGLFDDDDDDMIIDATGAPAMADSDDDDMPTKRKSQPILDDDDESKDTDIQSKDAGDMKYGDIFGDEDSVASAPKPEVVYKYEGPKFASLQKPFQPSSTPEHLAHRFMVWNSIGIIKQFNTEDENSIEIEFHDTSVHHAMHVTNSLGHSMADISSEAVVLACKSDEETASKLVCMHFSSWDNTKEWSVSMPNGEDIQVVTIGDGWIAAATDKRLVRLFSIGGLQLQVISLPGPVVSMAAHTNQLLIAYHQGMGIPGDQCLAYRLQHVRGKKRSSHSQSLPLSVKSTLTWLGFSAEGTPFMADSQGAVRILNRKFGSSWMQVANTKTHCKGKSDHYWIVGIVENPQQLRCIPCKGSMYPPTLPRPAVSVLPFQLPFCEPQTEKGQLEETMWRSQIFTNHYEFLEREGYEVDDMAKRQATLTEQESLMKLFALSCKTEHEYLATEICEMMPSHHPVQLAIKYASKLRLLQLAERIGEIARQKAEEETLAQPDQEDDDEYSMPVMSRNFQRRMVQRQDSDADDDDVDQEDDVQMEDGVEPVTPSGPMLKLNTEKSEDYRQSLPSSAPRKNPFKVGSQKGTPTSTKGTSVFDSMTPPVVSISKKTIQITKKSKKKVNLLSKNTEHSVQPKLFQPKTTTMEGQENKPQEFKRPRSAFQMWYEENKSDIQSENPDVEEPDIVLLATRKFKELSKEEKEVWSKKAKDSDTDSVQNDTKKRKREDNGAVPEKDINISNGDITNKKKKPLSQTTNSKLSGFSFNKE